MLCRMTDIARHTYRAFNPIHYIALEHTGNMGSKKVPDLSHLGPIWPTLEPNLTWLWYLAGRADHQSDDLDPRRHQDSHCFQNCRQKHERIWKKEYLSKLFLYLKKCNMATAGIKPQTFSSWCEQSTDVTTEQSIFICEMRHIKLCFLKLNYYCI